MREAAENRVPVVADGRVLQRRREAVPAAEVGADGCGVERGAVAELDALPELERPGQAVLALLPAQRELRSELRPSGLESDEAVEDLVGCAQRRPVRDERRVEQRSFAVRAEDDRLARLCTRKRDGGADERQRRHERGKRKIAPCVPHCSPFEMTGGCYCRRRNRARGL